MCKFSKRVTTQYDPQASDILGKDYWRVTGEVRCDIGPTQHVTIPAGYLTDGATVPKIFWSIIPPWGPYADPVVLHDLLCEYLSIVEDGRIVKITRAQCDQIFNEAMKCVGVPSFKRKLIYAGVSAYRAFSGTNRPTTTPLKRKLEALWRGE